jgi:FtsZ-binding cell division protein ZapB
MGGYNSKNKNTDLIYEKLLKNNNIGASNDLASYIESSINNSLDPLKYEINKLKEDNQKIKVEIKFIKEKIDKLDYEINKIQNNHGKEIFTLNEAFSLIQKDTVTLINNQKIISEVLQKISEENQNQNQNQNNSLIKQNISSFYNSVNQ